MAKEKGGKRAQSEKIEAAARELVTPIIEQAGYTLWDVCFEKEGAWWYLRVLFDKEGGIDSDECEAITAPINALFDKQSFIEQVDVLEIGSPGLSKKLRLPEHFLSSIGTKIRALVKDENGRERSLHGVLESYDEEKNTITLDSGEVLAVSRCIKIHSDM